MVTGHWSGRLAKYESGLVARLLWQNVEPSCNPLRTFEVTSHFYVYEGNTHGEYLGLSLGQPGAHTTVTVCHTVIPHFRRYKCVRVCHIGTRRFDQRNNA